MQEKIIDAFNFRHACKEFDPVKKVSDEDFEFILETGRLSPSSFGYSPWKFLIIQNMEIREKIKPFTWGGQGQLPTASHIVLVLARKTYFMKYDSQYLEDFMRNVEKLPDAYVEGKRNAFKDFQINDFKMLESERALFDWSCKQTYIALGNMMTAAAMIGIDSCPIEGFNMDKMESFLASELDIDTDKFGASHMIAFGYRKNDQPVKTRHALNDITQWYR